MPGGVFRKLDEALTRLGKTRQRADSGSHKGPGPRVGQDLREDGGEARGCRFPGSSVHVGSGEERRGLLLHEFDLCVLEENPVLAV